MTVKSFSMGNVMQGKLPELWELGNGELFVSPIFSRMHFEIRIIRDPKGINQGTTMATSSYPTLRIPEKKKRKVRNKANSNDILHDATRDFRSSEIIPTPPEDFRTGRESRTASR